MSTSMQNVIPGWLCHVLFYYVFVIYEICVPEMNVICETRFKKRNRAASPKILVNSLSLMIKCLPVRPPLQLVTHTPNYILGL